MCSVSSSVGCLLRADVQALPAELVARVCRHCGLLARLRAHHFSQLCKGEHIGAYTSGNVSDVYKCCKSAWRGLLVYWPERMPCCLHFPEICRNKQNAVAAKAPIFGQVRGLTLRLCNAPAADLLNTILHPPSASNHHAYLR